MRRSIQPILNFSVILDQETGKLTLREGDLLKLEIPKQWQKPDHDTKNPALWVCHLPKNSWGINMISFFPTELEIKKSPINTNEFRNSSFAINDKNNSLTYRGSLEITSETENKIFYRCQLKVLEEENKGSQGVVVFLVIMLFIIAGIFIAINIAD